MTEKQNDQNTVEPVLDVADPGKAMDKLYRQFKKFPSKDATKILGQAMVAYAKEFAKQF